LLFNQIAGLGIAAIMAISTPLTFSYVSAPTSTVNTPPEEVKTWHEKLLETPELLAVARCESGLRQFNKDGTVLRGVVNPQDVGILQINERYHLEESRRLGIDIYTLEGNIEYGFILYSTQGLRPWFWSEPCWGKTAE